MSQDNDGEAAGVVVNSHGDHEHDNGTIRSRADADTEEDEERGGGQESFFQCLDGQEQPSGMDDARVEFPSDDEDGGGDGDDARFSFATAVGDGDRLLEEQSELDLDGEEEEDTSRYDYGTWMAAEPMSIQERRRRLLQGMGLTSSRDLLRSRNARAARLPPDIPRSAPRRPHLPPSAAADDAPSTASPAPTAVGPPRQPSGSALSRSRSDSRLAVRGGGARKPPPSLRRVCSLPHSLHSPSVSRALRAAARRPLPLAASSKDEGIGDAGDKSGGVPTKGQDSGKEFTANGKLNGAAQRSVPLSMDEFERFVGSTPFVKQFIRRSRSQPVPAGAANKGGEKPVAEKKRTRWLKNIKLVASAAGLSRNEKDKDGDQGGGRSARTMPPAAAAMSKSASVHAAVSMSPATTGPERLKVHHYGKSSKELTGLYMRQEVRAHEGSIWSIKFSPDGRFLASGGEDHVVRVWEVVDVHADASTDPTSARELSAASLPLHPPPQASTDAGGRPAAAPGLAAQLSRRMRRGRSGKDVLLEHVVVPESAFALAERPACAFEGHQDDVLDLSWSKSQQLLSSSMDKTVRLWDMDTKTCLKMFPHNDYGELRDPFTCVQFNPVDDGYFISGSLDCKVRIWSVPDRQVVDWSDVSDMVTAACYTPDGQAQIDMSISKKRRSQAKKITGFQFAPGNPSEILVTSADSQIRVFNGITVLQKFKGFKNTSSQISASYTADGRYVVCASEDSNVYVWRRVPVGSGGGGGGGGGGGAGGGIGVRAKTWLTSRSYEYFFCRDVSVAVPWPGSPSFRCDAQEPPSSRSGGTPKKQSSARGAGDDDDAGGVSDVQPRRHKSGPMGYPGGQQLQPELSRRQSSARWHGGAEGGNAWGMVVVTASRGGEIRVYQNFGLPLGNLFH
ncbi:WD repeat-containing protein 44-like [Setaria italica]|uniref:WD repeat-containing protein 44-like n=1 Tax=Setaria italica TaxID=4555 RepID=UPI000BE4E130|nr:WD repeat-containing protein 44-like [Setaria italica]